MGFLDKMFGRAPAADSLSDREMIIAQVVSTHQAWYPAHNAGAQAPEAAVTAWIEKLARSRIPDHEMILLVSDNKSRNQLLGKTWP